MELKWVIVAMMPETQVLLRVPENHVVFEPRAMNLNRDRSRLCSPVTEILAARPKVITLHVAVVISTARGDDLEFVTWNRKKILERSSRRGSFKVCLG